MALLIVRALKAAPKTAKLLWAASAALLSARAGRYFVALAACFVLFSLGSSSRGSAIAYVFGIPLIPVALIVHAMTFGMTSIFRFLLAAFAVFALAYFLRNHAPWWSTFLARLGFLICLSFLAFGMAETGVGR